MQMLYKPFPSYTQHVGLLICRCVLFIAIGLAMPSLNTFIVLSVHAGYNPQVWLYALSIGLSICGCVLLIASSLAVSSFYWLIDGHIYVVP